MKASQKSKPNKARVINFTSAAAVHIKTSKQEAWEKLIEKATEEIKEKAKISGRLWTWSEVIEKATELQGFPTMEKLQEQAKEWDWNTPATQAEE